MAPHDVVAFVAALALVGCSGTPVVAPSPAGVEVSRCFLLHEVGVGEVRRAPDEGCRTRVTPASTFKIPHALAALDAGIIEGAAATLAYDGAAVPFPAWRGDQSLRTAMRSSVVWYFQRIAERLGAERERAYLTRLGYGNADSSSGLTSFWLGGSLLISPEEQARFLLGLFGDALPVATAAHATVREVLVQPTGKVVNATGEHPFAAPWPSGTIVSAKTGAATNHDGRAVRWLVGHVRRAPRRWVFVACVVGGAYLAPSAAMELAAGALKEEGVL